MRLKAWHALDGVECELEPVDVVEHAHVEGGGGCALFLVAAHVQAVVVVTPVSEPVNDPRIAVEGEDDGDADGKELVEFLVGQAVRMFGGGLQGHEVHYVHDTDAEVGNAGAEQADSGQGFHGGHVSAAGDNHFRAAFVVRCPLPNAEARGAVRDGFVDGEPLRRWLLAGDDEVDVVAAAQAVIGNESRVLASGGR